jgi:hypothetical protein
MKCSWKGINFHRTRDQASPGAIEMLKVAAFPPPCSGACECTLSGGKIAPEACSGFTIFDEDGKQCAHFSSRYRMSQGEDGGIVVYSMPSAQSAQTQDSTPIPCRDFTEHFSRLAQLNTKNSVYWTKRNAEG